MHFLERHQGWLLTKLAKFSTDAALREGGTILFGGVSHRIHHTGSLRGLTEAMAVDGKPVLQGQRHAGASRAPRLQRSSKKEARADLEKLANTACPVHQCIHQVDRR